MKKKGIMVPDEVLLAKDINSTEKVVMAYIINRLCNSGQYGEDVTQTEIAEKLNTTLVTVNKCMVKLVENGYLIAERVKYQGSRYRNIYTINWERIAENEEKSETL